MEDRSVLTPATVNAWITVHVATLLGLDSSMIDPAAPLENHETDTVDAVKMALQLESECGRPIHPESIVERDKSIDARAERLVAS